MEGTAEINKMLEELDDIEKGLDGIENEVNDIDISEIKETVHDSENALKKNSSNLAYADIKRIRNNIEEINDKLADVDHIKREVMYMRGIVDDKLSLDFYAMYENMMEHMDVEAIKIYRNLQAVIVEENAKQNSALFDIDGKSDSLKKRLNKVIIFSIVSFVVSILVMLMQILPALGIDLF